MTGRRRVMVPPASVAALGGGLDPTGGSNTYRPVDIHAGLKRAWQAATPSAVPVPLPTSTPMPAVDPYVVPQAEDAYYAQPAYTTAQPDLPEVTQLVASMENDVQPPLLPKDPNPSTERIKQLIVEKARAMGLPPDIALGQVEQESTFNPNATGKAGEYGLFQIHPKTAPVLGLSKADAYDIHKNIDAGLRYFADMMKLTRGDVAAALQAYNGGPGNWRAGKVPAGAVDYSNQIRRRAEKYRQYAMR